MVTYAKAREALLAALPALGWEVKAIGQQGKLKVPYASKDGYRVWFKAQAVHMTIGTSGQLSLWCDIRRMTAEEFSAYAARKAATQKAMYERLEG